jgi:hypothetical protein
VSGIEQVGENCMMMNLIVVSLAKYYGKQTKQLGVALMEENIR